MLKQIGQIFLLVVLLTSCSVEKSINKDNSLTEGERADGWILLFDGNDINSSWRGFKMETSPTNWIIDDGAIFLDPQAGGTSGDIITREKYGQFELTLEWKVAPGSNSGIFYHVVESDQYKFTYETAPEMQVLDNDGHGDGKIFNHRAGNLYDLIAGTEGVVKPVGEWNLAEIVSYRGKLDFYLNGVNVVSTTYGDDAWRKMIANSKFKTMPDFGKIFKGHIALQDHGDNVWYKNIMVKKL